MSISRSVRFDFVPTVADLQASAAAGKNRPLGFVTIEESDGVRYRVGKLWASRFGGLNLQPDAVLDNRTGQPILTRSGRPVTQTWLPDSVVAEITAAFAAAHPAELALAEAMAAAQPSRSTRADAIPLGQPKTAAEPDDDGPAFD